jgi:AcrR family transcriptional regulator
MTSVPSRNRRADAQRSRISILDAAMELLSDDPESSMEAIAAAAGVTRQTVYAHFTAREHLLAAVLQRVTDTAVATLDALDLDGASATDALLRLLEVSARITASHRRLFRIARLLPVSPAEDRRRQAPALERLKRIIVRGQQIGEFDNRLPPDWLATAVIQLGHAAGDEVDAGTMTHDEAVRAMRISVLRVLDAHTSHDSKPYEDEHP